jgi:hypothetical protein
MKTPSSRPRFGVAFVLVLMAVGPLNVVTRAFSSGPPAGYTGAPGEANCTVCHNTFAVNTGTAGLSVSVPQTFVPSTAHPVNVTFSNTTNPRHGFEVTARDGNNNAVGSWQVVMFNGQNVAQTKDAFGSTVHHEHSSAGNTLTAWTMNWVAPATLPNGPVTFYVAGNQANMSFTPDGDFIYTRSTKMFQAALSTPATGWPIGTTQPLALSAPTHPGEIYFIVPSGNPTPQSFGGPFVLEVTVDWDFLLFALSTPQVFQNLNGNLDVAGHASASVTIPFYPPLIGFPLHFAGITANAQLSPTEVSNRVTVTFQ